MGRKKIVRYRVVVADSRMQRDGRFLENVGTYDPQANPKKFEFKLDRISYWLKQGAEPSETVANLLKQDRTMEKIEAVSKGLAPGGRGAAAGTQAKSQAEAGKERAPDRC